MAGTVNKPYPPILDTYAPSFIYTKGAKIYLSLSKFNNYEDIKSNAQITIRYQNNNLSALNKASYPTGIMLRDVEKEKIDGDRYRYFITILPSDMQDGFQLNQYYKLQIRFSGGVPLQNGDKTKIDSWLIENAASFSEWSTVCLIRGISQPRLKLSNFARSDNLIVFSQTTLALVGKVNFESGDDETVKSYQANLYDSNKKLLATSNIQYCNSYTNINEINYTFNYMLQDGQTYILEFEFTTRNLYTEKQRFDFLVLAETLGSLPVEISTKSNPNLGSIMVELTPTNTKLFSGNVAFRRSSSESNFTDWEDVHIEKFENQLLEFSWIDKTVQSGIDYKYCVQKVDSTGARGVVVKTNEPTQVILEDMFFLDKDKQIRIKFNQQVSSFKKNIAETKTDTIGSKFPFVKRNGAMEYRQFAISGLISYRNDNDNLFPLDEVKAHDSTSGGSVVQENNENEYIKERQFREQIVEFLYNNTVKLMKTTTEGNVLVKLMDINFTPEQTLGRLVYSFSTTAYEIDDYSISNLYKYNILTKTDISDSGGEDPASTIIKTGQLNQSIPANTNTVDIIKNQYVDLAEEGYMITMENIEQVTIEFNQPPYLIKETAEGLVPVGDEQVPDTLLGYLMVLNGNQIFVSPEGIYSLGTEIKVTSLTFPIETAIILDYVAYLKQEKIPVSKTRTLRTFAQERRTPETVYTYDKIGQLWGAFKVQDSIVGKIRERYEVDFPRYSQKVLSIDQIKVNSDVGTICWIKMSSDDKIRKFLMNETETMNFYSDTAVIESFYFGGIQFIPADERELQRADLEDNKFIEIETPAESLSQITVPTTNGVYTVGTDRYIYYKGSWHLFFDDNTIKEDIQCVIDYHCEVMKGVYA